jgi:hypothetical protein
MFTVAPLQLSDAVGAVNDGAAVQFIVLLAELYRLSCLRIDCSDRLCDCCTVLAASIRCIPERVYTLLHELPVVVPPTMFTLHRCNDPMQLVEE